MTDVNDGRERVRTRVADEMARLNGMTPTELARRAGVDADTVGDFLSGKRWPNTASRAKISTALGWVPEGIAQVERGEEPGTADETVGDPSQTAGVLLKLSPEAFEGLDPLDRQRAEAEATAAWLRVAQEARRRADEGRPR